MGETRFGADFDDIVYGAYVRERDIMEIPASGRLFMGQRHVAARGSPCSRPEDERRS